MSALPELDSVVNTGHIPGHCHSPIVSLIRLCLLWPGGNRPVVTVTENVRSGSADGPPDRAGVAAAGGRGMVDVYKCRVVIGEP